MPHIVIRCLQRLFQWPFLKISLFRGAVTHVAISGVRTLETYSIHRIRGILCDKSSASHFLIHSKQDLTIQSHDFLDHVVTFLIAMTPTESSLLVRLYIFFCPFDYIWNCLFQKNLHLSVLSQCVHNLGWRGQKRERAWSQRTSLSWKSSWKLYGFQRLLCCVWA